MMSENENSESEDESTISKEKSKVSTDRDSQECAGLGSKRSNGTWAAIRGAHKNVRKSKRSGGGEAPRRSYAQVVAE